jgi:hypothetical protein
MSERLKEHDWKSCVRPQRCTAGSNPALSAIKYSWGQLTPLAPLEKDSRAPRDLGL